MPQDKLIMFDFDGVIADSLDEQSRAFVDTLRAHGIDELATPATFLDFTETNWFEALDGAGLPDSIVTEIEDAFGAVPSPGLFPEMAGVIERLAAEHPVVVITSSRTADVEAILVEHGVTGVAEVIGGDVEPSKTRKIRSARRRYGESRQAWYVCDTVGDVREARDAGAVTVGVAWGGTGRSVCWAPARTAWPGAPPTCSTCSDRESARARPAAGSASDHDAAALSGLGRPSGALAFDFFRTEGRTKVLPSGPTAPPCAARCPSPGPSRRGTRSLHPSSQRPALGLPVTVTGSPGIDIS